jgi:hypothetical protein
MMKSNDSYFLDFLDFSECVVIPLETECTGVQTLLESIADAGSLASYSAAYELLLSESRKGHLTRLEASLLKFILNNETALHLGCRIDDALKSGKLLLQGDEVEHFAAMVKEIWGKAVELPLPDSLKFDECSGENKAVSKVIGNDY